MPYFTLLNYFSVPANILHLISDNSMDIKQKTGVRLRLVWLLHFPQTSLFILWLVFSLLCTLYWLM